LSLQTDIEKIRMKNGLRFVRRSHIFNQRSDLKAARNSVVKS
jgi:hypothetical protein